MAIRLPRVLLRGVKLLSSSTSSNVDVPKGFLAVYVGETLKKQRYVIPTSFLNQPLFQKLLNKEYEFNHPMGGLTLPCTEEAFLHLTSRLR